MAICKNCGLEYDRKYCPECGQRAKVKRITGKAIMQEVRQRLLHYDSGFFYTAIQLIRRPGHTIREYIEGKRVRHFKPVKFILWATALNFLVFHLIGLDAEIKQAVTAGQKQNPLSEWVIKNIFEHPAVMILFLVPNIALFSRWYFKRHGYNYAEHLVLNIFLMGQLSLFGVVLNPLNKFVFTGPALGAAKMVPQVAFSLCYMAWAYLQYFQPRRRGLAVLKGVLAVLSGYFFMLILVSILVALMVVLFWPLLKPVMTGQ